MNSSASELTPSDEINPEYHFGKKITGRKRKRSGVSYKYSPSPAPAQKKRRLLEYNARRAHRADESEDESEDDSNESDNEEIDMEELMAPFKNVFKNKLSDVLGKEDHDEMGKKNHIYFDESVTKKSCRKLTKKIEELNIKLGKLYCDYDMNERPKIYLHINSYGGDAFQCFSVIDTIRRSKFPIVSIIDGASASAATLISVSCHKRWMSRNAYMLIHQIRGGCWGTMVEMEDEFENTKEVQRHICEIYRKNTNMRGRELDDILKHDLWWRADQCLRRGLVDKII